MRYRVPVPAFAESSNPEMPCGKVLVLLISSSVEMATSDMSCGKVPVLLISCAGVGACPRQYGIEGKKISSCAGGAMRSHVRATQYSKSRKPDRFRVSGPRAGYCKHVPVGVASSPGPFEKSDWGRGYRRWK